MLAIIIFRIAVILIFALSLIPILILLERKVSGFIQDRPGPNRTNICGIRLGGVIQSLADALKLVIKENFIPNSIKSKKLFNLAPTILFITSLLCISVIPFADYFELDGVKYLMAAIPFDGGMLWYFGFASLGVYGILIAGISSNNKYSLLGSLRCASGVISYEIPMGLSAVSMMITYSSINLQEFVSFQESHLWGFLLQPLAAIIFIVCGFAESNRVPFDVAEGESEIVAGYHVEYSGMSFGMFFLAEYISMIAMSALIVTIFFGGYSLPFMGKAEIMANYQIILFAIAILLTIFCIVFIKWLKKCNVTRYKCQNDLRKKENSFYIKSSILITAILDFVCIYFALQEVGAFGLEVINLVINILVFSLKTFLMILVFLWVRWTLPRFRFDQIQKLGWEKLLPLSIINIIVTALVVGYVG